MDSPWSTSWPTTFRATLPRYSRCRVVLRGGETRSAGAFPNDPDGVAGLPFPEGDDRPPGAGHPTLEGAGRPLDCGLHLADPAFSIPGGGQRPADVGSPSSARGSPIPEGGRRPAEKGSPHLEGGHCPPDAGHPSPEGSRRPLDRGSFSCGPGLPIPGGGERPPDAGHPSPEGGQRPPETDNALEPPGGSFLGLGQAESGAGGWHARGRAQSGSSRTAATEVAYRPREGLLPTVPRECKL